MVQYTVHPLTKLSQAGAKERHQGKPRGLKVMEIVANPKIKDETKLETALLVLNSSVAKTWKLGQARPRGSRLWKLEHEKKKVPFFGPQHIRTDAQK